MQRAPECGRVPRGTSTDHARACHPGTDGGAGRHSPPAARAAGRGGVGRSPVRMRSPRTSRRRVPSRCSRSRRIGAAAARAGRGRSPAPTSTRCTSAVATDGDALPGPAGARRRGNLDRCGSTTTATSRTLPSACSCCRTCCASWAACTRTTQASCEPGALRALLVPLPKEQHTFGLSMVSDFFRRGGWQRQQRRRSSPKANWRRWSGNAWFDVVGLSLVCDERLEYGPPPSSSWSGASRSTRISSW